ncbi:fructose-6-phosphate aldolase [Enterococcus sp. CSURQ0835]|uniref:fructose-6-phosphate aldolase n=1 Tax=Enterococcus sp. CSURQ0835 TaxID=2681394 RepID=UPI001357B154|nr:fructose-6-phosphate aldolase [Enterococcus sp. CSURQ0835]
MEFLLDTINLTELNNYLTIIPVAGLTSTPSIIKREGKVAFIEHMKKIRAVLGTSRTLHVQAVARDAEGLIKDAQTVWEKIDPAVYIKIPTTKAGLQAINYLKHENPSCHLTATAVYTKMQAFLALQSKADYIAVYSNRSENVGVDPFAIIQASKQFVQTNHLATKIMASSIKNVAQITESIENGADAVTCAPAILATALDLAVVDQAVDRFTADWLELYQREELY